MEYAIKNQSSMFSIKGKTMEKAFIQWEKENKKHKIGAKSWYWPLNKMEEAEYNCSNTYPLLDGNYETGILSKDPEEALYRSIYKLIDSEPQMKHRTIEDHNKYRKLCEYNVREYIRKQKEYKEQQAKERVTRESFLNSTYILLTIDENEMSNLFNEVESKHIRMLIFILKEANTVLEKRRDRFWRYKMYEKIITTHGRRMIKNSYNEYLQDFQ